MAAPPLILASASPQRRAILTQLGVGFEVRPTGVEEDTEGDAAVVAEVNARRKAAFAATGPLPEGTRVLGADTVVELDGAMLGKPSGPAEARNHLRALAGRTHTVVGGIAVAERGAVTASGVARTAVTFRPAGEATVEWYVRSGEWRDRAGGYAIQGRGAALVARIDGDYPNVVGLPVALLLELLPELLPIG